MSLNLLLASVVDIGSGHCCSRHVAGVSPGYSMAVEKVAVVGYRRTAEEAVTVEGSRRILEVAAGSSSRDVAAAAAVAVAAEAERILQDSCSRTCPSTRLGIVYMVMYRVASCRVVSCRVVI